ncbi:hypothetical protein AAFF_G00243990 [Aldrovandia affinis]|uniref:Uncharacterized protein n=1 Tax=Aldrovandia affinis TaxID=143900 RepID=A0AAD7W3P2_9TELE|nr:hypothetical protein AAFF_G00243990 [Aldrovandia affinis]
MVSHRRPTGPYSVSALPSQTGQEHKKPHSTTIMATEPKCGSHTCHSWRRGTGSGFDRRLEKARPVAVSPSCHRPESSPQEGWTAWRHPPPPPGLCPSL